jgi:hypothetical protein
MSQSQRKVLKPNKHANSLILGGDEVTVGCACEEELRGCVCVKAHQLNSILT